MKVYHLLLAAGITGAVVVSCNALTQHRPVVNYQSAPSVYVEQPAPVVVPQPRTPIQYLNPSYSPPIFIEKQSPTTVVIEKQSPTVVIREQRKINMVAPTTTSRPVTPTPKVVLPTVTPSPVTPKSPLVNPQVATPSVAPKPTPVPVKPSPEQIKPSGQTVASQPRRRSAPALSDNSFTSRSTSRSSYTPSRSTPSRTGGSMSRSRSR